MRKPLGLVAAAFLVSGLASAANRSPHSNPNGLSAPPAHVGGSFGTSSQSVLALTAWDFHPIASDVTYQYVSGGSGTPFGIYRTNASGNVWFEAPVHLPTGALIKQVEVTFCDTAGGDFFSFLAVSDKATGLVTYTDLVLSLSATPGCGSQVATLATPEQIDNDANSYTIEVNLGGTGTPGDNTVEMGQARVGWQLAVSRSARRRARRRSATWIPATSSTSTSRRSPPRASREAATSCRTTAPTGRSRAPRWRSSWPRRWVCTSRTRARFRLSQNGRLRAAVFLCARRERRFVAAGNPVK